MTFIRPIPPEDATGELEAAYERDPHSGRPGSIVRAWSRRPDALAATMALSDVVRSRLDEHRAELVRVLAASSVDCSVCTVAHGAALLESGAFDREQLGTLVTDHRRAGLDPVDGAIAEFVTKVVQDSHRLEPSDVDELRGCGLDDAEIFDIIVWAWFCTFWSGVHNAIGYQPPARWLGATRSLMGDELWETLSVGRRFETDRATDT